MRRSNQKYIDHLSPGDRFMWCERIVEVERTEPGKRYMRGPSRYVWVRLGDEQLRLHYYDAELLDALAVREGEG